MFVICYVCNMFEFMYYVSVIWRVELDLMRDEVTGSKMKWGETGGYQFVRYRFDSNAIMSGIWFNNLNLLAVCLRDWKKGYLSFFSLSMLGRFFSSWIMIWFFLIRKSWFKTMRAFHVHVTKPFLFKHDLWMTNWIKNDSRTILFCAINSWLFNGFGNVLFSNGCG